MPGAGWGQAARVAMRDAPSGMEKGGHLKHDIPAGVLRFSLELASRAFPAKLSRKRRVFPASWVRYHFFRPGHSDDCRVRSSGVQLRGALAKSALETRTDNGLAFSLMSISIWWMFPNRPMIRSMMTSSCWRYPRDCPSITNTSPAGPWTASFEPTPTRHSNGPKTIKSGVQRQIVDLLPQPQNGPLLLLVKCCPGGNQEPG